MPLFTDSVRLGQPGGHLIVDLGRISKPEHVDLVSRRDDVDPAEAWTLEVARQHHVAVHPMAAKGERRKAHADLKRDARLLRQHFDRSRQTCGREQAPKCFDHSRIAAHEMVRQLDFLLQKWNWLRLAKLRPHFEQVQSGCSEAELTI